jgi:hypothetical protein
MLKENDVCKLSAVDHCYVQGLYEIIGTVYSHIHNDVIIAHLFLLFFSHFSS